MLCMVCMLRNMLKIGVSLLQRKEGLGHLVFTSGKCCIFVQGERVETNNIL